MIGRAINLLDRKPELGLIERDEGSPGSSYTASSYIKIFNKNLLPAYYPGYIYYQDNARIYTAKRT
jgi:hypothetical protein